MKSFFYDILPENLRSYWLHTQTSQVLSRLAHGVFWSMLGAVVARLFGLATFVVAARILGKIGYGQFGVIQSTVAMFAVFAGFGLGQTANKYVAELCDKDPARTGRIICMGEMVAIGIGLLMAAILYLFAPWLATNTLAAPQLAPLLRISALILFFEAINGAQLGVLFGFELFKTSSIISVIINLLGFPSMLLGIYFGGLTGSIWALCFTRGVNCLICQRAIYREAIRNNISMSFKVSHQEFSILLHYSLPAMLSGLMVSPVLWVCNAMIVNQPKGYAQMGIFQAVDSFRLIIIVIATTINSPLLSMLASSTSNKTISERFARVNILSSWVIGFVPAIVLVSIPEIGLLIYGKDFGVPEFKKAFILVIFTACIVTYKHGFSRVLAVQNMMWWGMLSNFTWGVSMVVFTWFLLPYGALGFALAWSISYTLNTLAFIPLYTRTKLVPKGTLISIEAFYIWLILILCMTVSFFDFNLLTRLILVPVFLSSASYFFWQLLKYDVSQKLSLKS